MRCRWRVFMGVLDLRSVYVSNGTGIFILLILLYASHDRILRGRLEDKIYVFMIFGVMMGCVCEIFSYAIDGKVFPGCYSLSFFLNTYLYTFNMLLPIAVLFYIDLGLYNDRTRLWKLYKPQIIMAAVMILMNVVNWFTPVIFYVSPENLYSRRPLSYAYYVAIMYFLISALVLPIKYEKENGTKSFFNVYIFLFPVLIGAALQFMYYGLSMAWLSAAVGLTGLYMMQQNEAAYVDPLVETFNRQYLNSTLSSWINRGTPFVGVMLDVDRFKQVNDTYGHSEGDRVLKIVADILKAARSGKELVFRFAGDEFIVLKMGSDEEGLRKYMDEVNRRTDAYNLQNPEFPISLSYGMSSYRSGNPDLFMKEMDNRMYAMKQNHHSEK